MSKAQTPRYDVYIKIDFLNTWRMIAKEVTKTQAKTYEDTSLLEVQVKESK